MVRARKSAFRLAAAAMLGTVAVAVPASAAHAGTPPSCIRTTVHAYNVVEVHNNCGLTSFNIKVIWANGRDSSCFVLSPGSSRRENALGQPFASYDKTVTC